MRIVWVLGSGFSKPLGGPVLADLFTDGWLVRMKSVREPKNPTDAYFGDIDFAHLHYGRDHYGKSWTNAEEFLEVVDAANHPTDQEARQVALRRMHVTDVSISEDEVRRLSSCARVYLAAACDHFLPTSISPGSAPERWAPFFRWSANLGSHSQTVISFNYDRVVELIGGDRVRCPLPNEVNEANAKGVPLLKLHGSVNWTAHDGALSRWDSKGLYAPDGQIHPERQAIGIAGPGPSKQALTNQEFDPLWKAAGEALSSANVIVFIGYRFPPTDSVALERLLGAIAGNKVFPLTIRIVLGPDTGHVDVVRLRSLLAWALAHRAPIDLPQARHMLAREKEDMHRPVVSVEPLWSQDFMAVYRPSMLDAWSTR